MIIQTEQSINVLLIWSTAMIYLMYRTRILNKNKQLFILMIMIMFGSIFYMLGYRICAIVPFMVITSIAIWKDIGGTKCQ